MKRIVFFMSFLLLGCFISLWAHDFVATGKNGQKLYFKITDARRQYVEVTYQGSITSVQPSVYSGEVTIPAKVKHSNKVYQVTGISRKAFSNARELTGIILPSGLSSIGDFAFEGCTKLQKVVFPGNVVRFGEGVFFRCPSISQVTLGSDWTSVNLKMFRWSNQLASITIPAKLVSLQNLKSLKGLKTVEVDVNNPNFASVDGLLYNKNKTILLGCPRAFDGAVKVAEGTTTIYWGALADCLNITSVDLPASLKSLSFREFARLEQLTTIVMRGEKPLMTAKLGTKEVFLLKVVNPQQVELQVPKSAQKEYKNTLCSEEGEYTEIPGNIPEGVSPEHAVIPLQVKAGELLTKKQVKGKKF